MGFALSKVAAWGRDRLQDGRTYVAGGALLASNGVFAAVPAAFTSAVTDATADGAAMATALLTVAAAVVVVMIAIKFVKRLKGAV